MGQYLSYQTDAIRSRLIELFVSTPEVLAKIFRFMDVSSPETMSSVWQNLYALMSHEEAFKTYALSLIANIESHAWKDEIRSKLVDLYQTDPESLLRVFHHLDRLNANASDWNALKALQHIDHLLKAYAQHLIQQSREADNDHQFRAEIQTLHDSLTVAQSIPPSTLQVAHRSTLLGLAASWSTLPDTTKAQALGVLPLLLPNTAVADQIRNVDKVVSAIGSNNTTVGLAAVYVCCSSYQDIMRWYHGEIDGATCMTNILLSFVTMAAGVGGAIVGTNAGLVVAGPIGAVAGGMVGGAVSAAAVDWLAEKLKSLFGVGKTKALERAYEFLGVGEEATNEEINKAFKRMCLECHPDKAGGNHEKFHLLQVNMAVIKAARGQETN